jgi:prepilin-type N-terminal cleavage/methylation domain-containing protein
MTGWGNRRQQGFTIVELIIVVAVIAVLTLLVFVGYGAVVNTANDAAVKSDLQKIDDAMKQYSLKTEGIFPTTVAQLEESNLKLSDGVYYTGDRSNIYFCANGARTEYAVIAKSKSGKRFVQRSEQGVSEYTGSIVWDAGNINGWDTCADIEPDYTYLGIAAMNEGEWSTWANAVEDSGTVANLFTNPSATSTALYGGYGAPGTNTVQSSGGFVGDTFVRRSFTGTGLYGIYIGPSVAERIVVSPGETYTASGYVRTSTVKNIEIDIEWYTSSGTQLGSGDGMTGTTGTEWRRLYTTATAPATATNALIRFYSFANWANGQYLDVDAIMFTQGSKLYNYADGDVPGWSWSGSANASPSSGPTP